MSHRHTQMGSTNTQMHADIQWEVIRYQVTMLVGLCLTDRPSYINLTDAGSGSNKASWPHTGMHSHKEADARTHRDRFYSHSAFMRHMVESLQASKHAHTHLTSCHISYWAGGKIFSFHSGIKTNLFPLFFSSGGF